MIDEVAIGARKGKPGNARAGGFLHPKPDLAVVEEDHVFGAIHGRRCSGQSQGENTGKQRDNQGDDELGSNELLHITLGETIQWNEPLTLGPLPIGWGEWIISEVTDALTVQ